MRCRHLVTDDSSSEQFPALGTVDGLMESASRFSRLDKSTQIELLANYQNLSGPARRASAALGRRLGETNEGSRE